MARIRADYVFGTTTAALTATDTTLSSAGLAALPAVTAPDIAAVTLSDGTNHEVVYVTAHAASATTATITRGREGSTAQVWASGADWHHGATAADFDSPFVPDAGRSPRLVPFGVKLRGANVIPKGGTATNPWGAMYVDWAAQWPAVKAQVDAAASVGANSIRLIGDIGAVHAGTVTQADYLAAYEQFVDYCANLGLSVYACASDWRHWQGATVAEAASLFADLGAMLEGKPNVLGIDVVQEAGLGSGLTHSDVATLFTALRDVTTLPLTCSNLGSSNSSSAMWSTSTTAAFDDLVDFYDFHPYYDGMVIGDLSPLFAATSKPIILGEYGADAANPARYSAAAAVSEDSRIVGSFAWAIVDYNATGAGGAWGPTGAWGLFDYSFSERTTLTTIFRTVPDREDFTAGGHIVEDEGAALPARSRLNFVGAGVNAADDPASDATTITIAGGSGGGTPTLVGCRVKRTTTQVASLASVLAVSWDGESYDTDSFHDTATNPSRITVPTGLGGTYAIGGGWAAANPIFDAGRAIVILRVNGTTDIAQQEVVATGANSQPSPFVSTTYQLAAGDYVEMFYFYQTGGTPGLAANVTQMYVTKIG